MNEDKAETISSAKDTEVQDGSTSSDMDPDLDLDQEGEETSQVELSTSSAPHSDASPRARLLLRPNSLTSPSKRSSRSSRPNSINSTSSPLRSTSEDDAFEVLSTSSSSSDVERASSISSNSSSKKLRKKRIRHVDESERLLAHKASDLERALLEDDLERLRDLAISEGGLLSDGWRRRVWPRLVNIKVIEADIDLPSQAECEAHKEYNQVNQIWPLTVFLVC